MPPLIAAALVALAGLAAARLPQPPWIARFVRAAGAASPVGWYLAGVVLGPGLGLLDLSLLTMCTPVLACAAGWVGALVGARLAAPIAPDDRLSLRGAAEVGAAVLIPGALLFAAARFLPHPLAPAWPPIIPVIATLAAAVTLTSASDGRRASLVALAVAAAAQLARLPHGGVADLKRGGIALACAVTGIVLAVLVVHRIGRRAPSPLPGAFAAISLGAGLGLATTTSPLVVCALIGFALARWSNPFARLADALAPSEPGVTTVLWVAAGSLVGGPFPSIVTAIVALALWPIVRQRLATAPLPVNRSFGLAVAFSFFWTGVPATRTLDMAVVTAAALAMLLTRVTPGPEGVVEPRLTSGGSRVEVTA